MPVAVDGLTRESSDEAIDEAISSCIGSEIGRGKEQSQAIAICHSIAREKTGKELKPKNKRFPTMKG